MSSMLMENYIREQIKKGQYGVIIIPVSIAEDIACYIENHREKSDSVRHGHWVKKEPVFSKDTGIYRYECSECHCTDEHNEDREVPYCWQCGALMDEAEFALVRHGKWVESECSAFNWECSVCGHGLTEYQLPYCYDCGAKMDAK